METTTLNGTELAYETRGSGEPVLLVGTGPFADSFLPFFAEAAVARRFQLIRYRQRGQVKGERSPGPTQFEQHAADAASLLAHLGFERAHVAGHSTGAAIALQLALDSPEFVRTLALLEPPLMSATCADSFLAEIEPALEAYEAGDREAAMAAFLTVVTSLDWEACQSTIERHLPGGIAQAIADADLLFGSYLPALGAWRWGPDQASAVYHPVLAVRGAQTAPLFAESHALLRAWLPRVEECVIDGVAHLLHLQRPEPVARCVAGFFDGHPISA